MNTEQKWRATYLCDWQSAAAVFSQDELAALDPLFSDKRYVRFLADLYYEDKDSDIPHYPIHHEMFEITPAEIARLKQLARCGYQEPIR